MRERLAIMPFELATLLRPRNVRLAIRIDSGWRYLRYLRQPVAVKRVLLAELLRSRGIPVPVAEIVADERHRFVRKAFGAVAYMDRGLPSGAGTHLMPPGLLALMLDMSRELRPNALVCEVGSGVGLHTACMLKLHPGTYVVGVEESALARDTARNHLDQAGYGGRYELTGETDTDWAIASADLVYVTTGLSQSQLARMTRFGKPGSTWVVLRQLSLQEFHIGVPLRLWQPNTTYEHYRSGFWNQFMALERFTLEPGGARQRQGIVFGVKFLRYMEADHRFRACIQRA